MEFLYFLTFIVKILQRDRTFLLNYKQFTELHGYEYEMYE